MSRILTVTKVKFRDAVKIALQLKKKLVDLNLLNVSQSVLESHLFDIMSEYGYGGRERGTAIYRFQLMTHFHHQRVPLLIVLYGTGCVGKSTLATQLGERLNIPNVLQTDLILDVMSTFDQSLAPDEPVWMKKYGGGRAEFLRQYRRECIFMKSALQGDIEKCFNEGKAIIIEGSHIDPLLFFDVINHLSLTSAGTGGADDEKKKNKDEEEGDDDDDDDWYGRLRLSETDERVEFEKIQRSYSSLIKSGKKGIVVPFFMSVESRDEHYMFFEQWLSARDELCSIESLGSTFEERLETLSTNFYHIQDYLVEYDEELRDVKSGHSRRIKVDVNLHRVEDTLDYLHDKVLQAIEQAYEDKAF